MNARTLLIVLFAAAVIVRAAPLATSPLPFNVDGFSAAATATGLLEGPRWAPSDHERAMPGAFLLLAAAGAATGVPTLFLAQPVFAIIGAAAVLSTFAFTRRALPPSTTARVAALTVIAFLGSFAYFTSIVMKQAVGYVLVPASLSLLFLAKDKRSHVLGAFILFTLPLFHLLVTVIAVSAALLGIVIESARSGLPAVRPRLLAVVGAAGFSLAWYATVGDAVGEAWHMVEKDPWLYVALLTLAAFTCHVATRRPRAVRRTLPILLAFPVVASILIIANAVSPVFEGSARSPPALVLMTLPYALILALAAVGMSLLLRTRSPALAPVLGVLAAVASFILFAFLRGLDAVSFYFAHRAADFAIVPIALGFAIGVAVAARRTSFPRTRVAGLMLLPLLTLPLALGGPTTLVFENQVATSEFAALSWADARITGALTTDTHWGNAMTGFFKHEVRKTLPWDAARGAPVSIPSIIGERWAVTGADAWPSGRLPFDVDGFAGGRDVIYANGAARVATGTLH